MDTNSPLTGQKKSPSITLLGIGGLALKCRAEFIVSNRTNVKPRGLLSKIIGYYSHIFHNKNSLQNQPVLYQEHFSRDFYSGCGFSDEN
jgi:hypothetical protein